MAPAHTGHKVVVRFIGQAAEVAATGKMPREVTVDVHSATPKAIVEELAAKNPLLRETFLHRNGQPRSSVRFLVNGEIAPFDGHIPTTAATAARLVIIVYVPCDG